MKRLLLLAAALLGAGCINYDNDDECGCTFIPSCDCDPAPPSYEGDGTADSGDDADTGMVDGVGEAGGDVGGVDESGGEWECGEDDDLVFYRCKGWVAGLHRRTDGTQPNRRYIAEGNQINDDFWATCTEEWVVGPLMADIDNAWVFDMCTDHFQMFRAGDYGWPANPDFTFVENKGIFGPSGFDTNGITPGGGEVPAGKADPDANGTVGDNSGGTAGAVCENIYPNAEQIQMFEVGELGEPPTCAAVSCSGWNPNGTVSYSINTGTKTITTSMPRSHFVNIFESLWTKLYECDDGRYAQTNPNVTSTSYETWKMTGLNATGNELLYRMGFRNNDDQLTIERNVAGATVYPLGGTTAGTGYNNQMTAGVAMYPYSSFKIKFRRSGVTWTMLLTLTT